MRTSLPHRALLRGAVTIAALALSAGVALAQSAPPGSREELLRQFNSSASRFEQLAQAMPADKFNWSPGPGVMTVAQVYAHVAHYNYRYPSKNMGVPLPTGVNLDTLEAVAAKAQGVALLRQSADFVRTAVKQMPESQLAASTRLYGRDVQRWAVLFQLLAHMNEHLGQSIAYARMNGVVPPWSS